MKKKSCLARGLISSSLIPPVHFCKLPFHGLCLLVIMLVAYTATAPSSDGFFFSRLMSSSMKSQSIWAIIYYSLLKLAMVENLSMKRSIEGQTMLKFNSYRIWYSSLQTCSRLTALSITWRMVFSSGGYISSYLPAICRAVIPKHWRSDFWKSFQSISVLSMIPTVTYKVSGHILNL